MENRVTHSEFVKELKQEVLYQMDGGTNYRKRTAELALLVAETTVDPYTFWERNHVAVDLFKRLPGLDKERNQDVSKMLSVVVRDLHNKKNRSSDVQRYVEMKQKRRKRVAFV